MKLSACSGTQQPGSGYRWERVIDLSEADVNVVIHEVTANELRRARRRFGEGHSRRKGLRAALNVRGFTALYRQNGEYRCQIFIRSADDQATLEHEMKHCRGWAHK